MTPSLGLIAMLTGEIAANLEHMKTLAIHQMNDAELDHFADLVRDLRLAADSLSRHIQQIQEQS